MKINIHTGQDIPPAENKPARTAASPAGRSLADQLSATPTGSNINSTLENVSGTRAARVSQLAALYASGRYVVNSTEVAQAMVSGAIA